MNSSDAFIKAALYQQCAKSSILKHVDLDNADTETLRELINKNNLFNIRKIPILLAKYVTRVTIKLAISKFPAIQSHVHPEDIQVRIEDDEMEYLLTTTYTAKPNIVFIVIKNIVLSMLGTSIETFTNNFMYTNGKMDGTTTTTTVPSSTTNMPGANQVTTVYAKEKIGNIPVVSESTNKLDEMSINPPRKFTNTFDTPPTSPMQQQQQQLQHQSQLNSANNSLSGQSITKIKPLKRLNSNSIATRSYNGSSRQSIKSQSSQHTAVSSNHLKYDNYRKELILESTIEQENNERQERQSHMIQRFLNSVAEQDGKNVDDMDIIENDYNDDADDGDDGDDIDSNFNDDYNDDKTTVVNVDKNDDDLTKPRNNIEIIEHVIISPPVQVQQSTINTLQNEKSTESDDTLNDLLDDIAKTHDAKMTSNINVHETLNDDNEIYEHNINVEFENDIADDEETDSVENDGSEFDFIKKFNKNDLEVSTLKSNANKFIESILVLDDDDDDDDDNVNNDNKNATNNNVDAILQAIKNPTIISKNSSIKSGSLSSNSTKLHSDDDDDEDDSTLWRI